MSYLIKPVNIRTGAKACGIISDEEKLDKAILYAKSKSRLYDFENWDFSMYAKQLKDKSKKHLKQKIDDYTVV